MGAVGKLMQGTGAVLDLFGSKRPLFPTKPPYLNMIGHLGRTSLPASVCHGDLIPAIHVTRPDRVSLLPPGRGNVTLPLRTAFWRCWWIWSCIDRAC